MEASSAPVEDNELAAAFERLRLAVAQRESEHLRQGRYRTWFGRGVLLFVVAIFVGLWMLVAGFNGKIFASRLESKVSDGAPGVLHYAKQTVEALAPIYQAEVERTMPKFLDRLTDTISSESAHLADAIAPLAAGKAGAYTTEADDALTKGLQAKFNKELKTEAEAHALAVALRNQQMEAAPKMLDGPLAGPFGALHDIEMSLRNMGPPDKELISKDDTIDALGKAALDVVKARLASGEGFGFEDDKGDKSEKKIVAGKGGR